MLQSALTAGAILAAQSDEQDAAALPSQFLNSQVITPGVALNLQKAIGPKGVVSSRANGKTIQSLRAEKRADPDAFNQRYNQPLDTAPAVNAGSEKNKRFYSNGLSKTRITPPSGVNQQATSSRKSARAAPATAAASLSGNSNYTTPKALFGGQHAPIGIDIDTSSPSEKASAVQKRSPETEPTPTTSLITRTSRRIFKKSRDKRNTEADERELLRATNRYIHDNPSKVRRDAKMQMQEFECGEDVDYTMSQDFADHLIEEVSDLKKRDKL